MTYKPRAGFQCEAQWSKADYLLTGGQAGPGKSWWLVFTALFEDQGVGKPPLALFEIPGYYAVIFRRELNQMEQLLRIAIPLYQHFGAKWKGQPDFCFIFPSGAKIKLSHMNNPDDWTKHRGIETHFYGFDELTEFLEDQVVNILPWLRSTIRGVRPRFAATCNPEGVGLDWVKRWWEIKCPCPIHKGKNQIFEKRIDESGLDVATKWEFIPGSRKGSVIEEMDPAYEAKLALLCGGVESPRFRALGQGCWEVAKGAFFGEFDRSIHVLPNDFNPSGNWNWSYMGGYDYASSPQGDAAAFVLGKVNENRDVIVENEWFGWGKGVVEQAEQFGMMHRLAGKCFADQDLFSRRMGGELKSIADQFKKDCDLLFHPAIKDIKNAASIVRSGLLATIHKRQGAIYVRERCKRLIDDLEMLLTDQKKFDEWDNKQRVTVMNNRYHFDVFQAFKAMYCGVFSTEKLPPKKKPMSQYREKAIKKARKNEEEYYDCSYSF